MEEGVSVEENRYPIPKQMTEAALVFFYTSEQARNFVVDFLQTAQANDLLMFTSLRGILREDNGESFRAFVAEDRAGLEAETRDLGVMPEDIDQALHDMDKAAALILRGRRDARAVVKDQGQFLLQTVFARVYAAFQIYLVELLTLIFQADPPSAEELGQRTLEEYVDALSRKKEQLYKDVYRKRLDLPLFNDETERNTEVLIAETRHIIEHNRGRISAQFLRNVQNFTKYTRDDIGKPVFLQMPQVIEDLTFLHAKVNDIDGRAIAKFGLRTLSIPTENMPGIEPDGVPALPSAVEQDEG